MGNARHDIAMFDGNLGPHCLQTLDVLIDRALPDGTSTRQGHARAPESGQQRAKNQNRRTHGAHELIRRCRIEFIGGNQNQTLRTGFVLDANPGPHALQQPTSRNHVAQSGDVIDGQGLCGQKTCTKNR